MRSERECRRGFRRVRGGLLDRAGRPSCKRALRRIPLRGAHGSHSPILDADPFLLAFHRAHPGCTSQAFGRGRVDGGGSSYDLLADCVSGELNTSTPLLDLGCGDGHLLELLVGRGIAPERLVGLDMSAEELDLAGGRPALRGSRLLQGRAAALPLPDGSVGAVLSHLAFMLMSDAEQVVREVRRVLASGAVFATVVGGGPKLGDSFEVFLDLLGPVLKGFATPMPQLGDPRCRSDRGLGELLGRAAGFDGPPRLSNHTVHLDGTLEQVWSSLSTFYNLYGLPAQTLRELRAAFEGPARALAPGSATIPCSMFVRLAVATRG